MCKLYFVPLYSILFLYLILKNGDLIIEVTRTKLVAKATRDLQFEYKLRLQEHNKPCNTYTMNSLYPRTLCENFF